MFTSEVMFWSSRSEAGKVADTRGLVGSTCGHGRDRGGDQLKRVGEVGAVGASNELLYRVHFSVPVEVEGEVDRRGIVHQVAGVGAGEQFVLGGHLGVCQMVPGLSN